MPRWPGQGQALTQNNDDDPGHAAVARDRAGLAEEETPHLQIHHVPLGNKDLSQFTPVPGGRIQPSPASSGFGAEFDSAARNSQSPPPEDLELAPPPPPVSGMVAKWRAVAMTEPQPDEDPIYGHLLTQVSWIASSTLENEASL